MPDPSRYIADRRTWSRPAGRAGRLTGSAKRRRFSERQPDLEPGIARTRNHPKIAAMPLGDHPIRDVQAQPSALPDRLGGEERFEDLLLHFRRYANARITDLDQGPAVLSGGAYGQRAAILHCVDGVIDRVLPD